MPLLFITTYRGRYCRPNIAEFSEIKISRFIFLTFIWLGFAELLILRIMVIHFVRTYRKTPYKIEKLFDKWRHFERLRVFHFLNKILNFVHIWPNDPPCNIKFPKNISRIWKIKIQTFNIRRLTGGVGQFLAQKLLRKIWIKFFQWKSPIFNLINIIL